MDHSSVIQVFASLIAGTHTDSKETTTYTQSGQKSGLRKNAGIFLEADNSVRGKRKKSRNMLYSKDGFCPIPGLGPAN